MIVPIGSLSANGVNHAIHHFWLEMEASTLSS